MLERFADLPELLENTVHIAERCTLQLDFGAYQMPEFPVTGDQTIEELLYAESR
jgi:DNA polymerase-3 subunit alpha